MTLQTLQNAMVSALKAGDKFRKTTISTLIAQIKKTAIDKGARDDITELLVNAELQKAKKQIEDSIAMCPNSRADLLEQYNKQKEIIMEFCPSLISDSNEIHNIILNCGVPIEKKNQGAIMKAIKTTYEGKIDMKAVNIVLKEMFNRVV